MNNKMLLLAAALQTVTLISFAQQSKTSTNNTVLVLGDFENEPLNPDWKGTVSVSKEFASHGNSALKVSSVNWQPGSLQSETSTQNWSGYQFLKFDIYNPSRELGFGSLQLIDGLATDEEAEADGQSYKGTRKLLMTKGWNHYEFMLETATTEEGNRLLALDKVRRIRFTFPSAGHAFFIDNIRLVAGKEGSNTLSRIDPADCTILIDNRYVYPSLSGPKNEITASADIKRLRQQANEAIAELEREVRIADMQGIQTLYQRIPLITADVGIGIRSKLAWFQNEEDEKEILNYVISSCNAASQDITIKLAAGRSNIIGRSPEDFDVSSEKYNSLDVPAYPPMKELKPADGYLRDKNGKPVILFSMLGIPNSGPLANYFAPNNHLLESFTVGGGSRYNIESSPVYEAFHKYPDAKRVGWDGWCGHLIKDRWAMGGKKENVVICLESDHIRQAVREYMRMHYREWKENPNLLYNIMAYELQYICYCNKSQQMFRDWLKSKYSNIGVVNRNWKTNYTSFNNITAPKTENAKPVDNVNRAAWFDWATFNTRRFTDYLKWAKAEILKLDTSAFICAGGTYSMLNSSNSISGIDEEMIINEVDDVILNESGSSTIYADLLLSLSDKKKMMFDPEMGGSTHNLLLHFLHGKADISKFWWASVPNKEFPHMNQISIPHSDNTSLADVAEVLRMGLDVRRLSSEIAEFTKADPEVAILYSKTSSLQVPPQQVQAGRTPYINAVFDVWEGSRFLGCRIGFVSEKQVLAGKLKKFRLLIVPAAKYILPEVVDAIRNYVQQGGTALVIPESFLFDQFARETNLVKKLGVQITDVTMPPVLGEGEKVQNYDQSFSQQIVYGDVAKNILTLGEDIFSGSQVTLHPTGLVQTIAPGNYTTLAKFEDGKSAIVRVDNGKGSLYYLAAPLKASDYHVLLSPLLSKLGITRPVIAVDANGELITGAEVRAVERENDYLIYASNLTADTLSFHLEGKFAISKIQDLRSLEEMTGNQIILQPFQETIFRIEKAERNKISK